MTDDADPNRPDQTLLTPMQDDLAKIRCLPLFADRGDITCNLLPEGRTNHNYRVHAGGGIVADSDPRSEYNEMLLKASNLLRALGTELSEAACTKL